MATIQKGKTNRILTVEVSTRELNKRLKDIEYQTVTATKDAALLTNFAVALIKGVRKYTPYRDEYKLKKTEKSVNRHKRIYEKDAEGNRTGKYKLGRTYTKLVADEYGTLQNGMHYAYEKDEIYHMTDKSGRANEYIIRSPHKIHSHELKAVAVERDEALKVPEAQTRKALSKVSDKKGYFSKRGFTKSSAKAFAEYSSQSANLHEIEKQHRINKILLKRAKSMVAEETRYADRPPHLRDSYQYFVNSKGRLSIVYSVKKPPDERFADTKHQKDYALQQYYAQDESWNRFTPGTGARWLEQYIGQDVGSGYKTIPVNGDENFKRLVATTFEKKLKQKIK